MAKQLNVNLAFQADTSSAEANIRKLQQSLTELSSIKAPIGTTLTKDMQVAVNSAKDLQTHLNNAFNVKTGNFDLKALNTSLKNSGQSLSDLTSGLLNAGLKGEQAFMNVQKAIASSSVQINQAQGALGNFLTTLKNTARWQISSSILHGFMGSMQSAYRYAQDLDKSLNNIRIVTGQNADQMARFAEQANKAAKELSATTTDYTNASLIYYQQGLDDKEVAERTNVTIKMANAAGESAQTVSDQMTAVWNNFDDGSKSLEYYADVMTALGAATASSTSEISEGLEKFASVAETVGLSYEYATAALATVTATTRQSADVVGTAFKTLFARIQDLELGKTLDDGTTLGQYSQALAAVGVNIKDANGEIKKMDIILEEMASKWNTLAKDQQISLAQSVAGVRQYTQLIALMDNWDFMQENLNTAYSSEGTLQEQADIYAESWEAARDRVRASMETLYNELIPTDFIIDMTDAFGDVIDVVGEFTSAIGGLPTILMLVANIMLNKMGPSITNTINSGISSVQEFGNKLSNISLQGFKDGFKNVSTGTAELVNNINTVTNGLKDANQQTEFFNNNLKEGLNSSSALAQNQQSIAGALERTDLTKSFSGYLKDVSQVYNLQGLIEQSKSKLTATEQEQLSLMQQQVLQASERKAKEQEILDTLTLEKDRLSNTVDSSLFDKAGYVELEKISLFKTGIEESNSSMKNLISSWTEVMNASEQTDVTVSSINGNLVMSSESNTGIANAARASANVYQNVLDLNMQIEEVLSAENVDIKEKSIRISEIVEKATLENKLTKEMSKNYLKTAESMANAGTGADTMRAYMSKVNSEAKQFASILNSDNFLSKIKVNIENIFSQWQKVNNATSEHNTLLQKTSNYLIQVASKASTMGGMLSKAFSGMSTIAMGINSVSNAFKTLKDEDADFGQKLTATTMGLTMGFNALKVAISGVGGVLNILQAKTIEVATVQEALSVANAKNILTEEGLAAAKEKNTLINSLANAQSKEEIASILTEIGIKNSEAAAQEFLNIKNEKGLNTAILKTLQNYKLAASEYAVLTPLLAIAAAVVAVIAVWKLFDYAIVNAEESLEQAKNQAKETSEALNEAKDAANELKSAFDNYKEIRTSLDDCIEGTKEWTEALKANNQEVLELLQKYPQLASMINEQGESAISTEGGITTIADWAMEDLQAQADQAVTNTQAASIYSNQKVRNAELTISKNSLTSKLSNVQGEAFKDGNDAGSLVKDYIKNNLDEFVGTSKESQTEALEKFFADNEISGNASQWVEAIEGLGPDFANLSASIDANTAATEAENAALTNELLADNDKVNNSKYANEIGKVIADGYDDKVAEEIKTLEDSGWGTEGISKVTGVNQQAKDIFDEYAKAAGITNYDLLDTKGTDKNRKFVYDDGNRKKTVSLEAMKAVVAAANASEKLSGAADKLVAIFDGRSGSDIAAITAASTGNVNDLTLDQLENGFDVEKLANSLSDEDLETLGMTRDEFIDSLNKTIEEGSNAFNDLANDYVKTVSDTLTGLKDSGKLQELTVGETQALADTLNTAFINGGSEATQKISEMFGKTGQDADEFADVLTSVDWQTTNVDDLNTALKTAGVTTHFTAEELQYLIDTLSSTGEMSIEAATGFYASMHEILDNISSGKTLNADDYSTLGEEYQKYFSLMADGTYKLTKDALDFYQAVHNDSIDNFKEIISNEQSNIEKIDNVASYGLDTLSKNGQIYNNQTGSMEVNQNHLSAQVDFLAATGYDPAQVQQLSEGMDDPAVNLEDYSAAVIAHIEALGGMENAEVALQDAMSISSAKFYEAQSALASTSSSMDELRAMYEEDTIGVVAYGEAVMAAHNEEKLEGLDIKEVEEYSKHLMKAADSSELLSKELKENEEAAEDVAAYTKKMNRGVETLSENFEGWSDILKKSDKSSEEYVDAMDNVKTAMSDVLGVQEDFLSDDFIISNMEDIEKAANGDADAIDRLAIAASRDILINIDIQDENVLNEVLALHDTLTAQIPDIEVGATINSGDFLAQAAQIVEQAGMTVDQANAYFRSMGFEPTFETKSVPVTRTLKGTKTYTTGVKVDEVETSSGPFKYIAESTTRTEEVDMGTATEMVEVPALTTDGGKPNFTLTRTNAGAMNNSSSSNRGGGKKGGGGGGGGSKAKPEKVDKTKKSDVVERYKEIEDKLDDVRNSMEDASRAADRLYGKNRIKEMKKVSDSLEKEVKLLKDKRKEAEKYLQTDKTALKNAAKDAGISFSFDSEGNIKNYEDEMTKLYNRLAAAEKKADPKNFKTKDAQDKYIEKNITPLKEKIEALEEAIDQYDETRELIEDLDDEVQEKFNEWQDNNFEILNYELELKLEVDDAELRKLEYLLSKIEDDFYSMAEAGALMIGKATKDADGNVTGLNDDGSQLDVYIDKFGDLQDQRDALKESFQKGEISEAAYIEGLQNLEDQAYDNAEAIQDLDNTMMHYYGDTLEAAQEELSKYTDMMDQHVEVLEHYANVMDIIGKSTDYKSMGEILEAQAEVAENNLAVSEANYRMLDEQRNQRKAEYEAAIGNATDEELAVLKQKWLDAEAAANDAQDEMMADAEEWAESLRAVVENKLAGLAQSLEKALTADFGGSFDQMSAQMERARDLQEEYLTDTNKIYETNKLINKAQQDIDKTTNTVAKKRLQNYIKETEQLQNKAKLSNYELEIQQAKYDLVLAEIALEEAQNAKSTVRLQRDAEGNFGYVYTADSSKVAEAEQQLADAQNRLYNIGLEGANEYTEKYQQTLAEMYDTLTELQTQYLEGAFASEEEYNTAVANAKEYYYAKLAQYSDLYTIALTTDSAVRVDAWSTDFDDMIYSTDKWQQSVNEYLGNVQSVFAEWETQVAKIREETVGKDLDALKQKTKDIKDESKKLKDQIADPKDGVIKAIKDEIEEVNKLTNAYAKARKQIKGTQTDHENFIKELRESIENPDKDKKKEDPVIPKKEEEPKKEDPQPTTPKTDAIDYDKIKKGTKVEVKSGQKWYYDSYGISPTGTARDGTIKYINRDGTHPFNIEGLGWIKQSAIKKVVKYDTGGYTGSWGPQGKLAMLHEKELILNKHDTENFLASMDVLDRILQAIDLRAMSSQLGGILTSPTFGGQMKEEHLEQNVTIEANFPGVSMASEIEEAFENIVNLASQYANRK